MSTKSILILDDHETARAALAQVLGQRAGYSVCQLPASSDLALTNAIQGHPDAVLMDVDTIAGDGIERCRRLLDARPQPAVYVLTTQRLEREARKSLAGVRGFLLKDLDLDALVQTLSAKHCN